MPRSTHRRSSSNEKGKRDYRHSRKDSEDRYYGSQTRKKIKDEGREKSRRPQYEQRGRRKQSYEQKPTIRIDQKQTLKQKYSQPQSEFKIHFRFKPIKIKLDSKATQELIKLLKEHISTKIGPVEYFKQSSDSRVCYLIIEFGFRYDNDAFSYLKGKFAEIDLIIQKEKVNISAEPSKAFKLLIDERKRAKAQQRSRSKSQQKKQKKQKLKSKKKRSYSRSKSSSLCSRSRSVSKRSVESRRQRHGKKKSQYKRPRQSRSQQRRPSPGSHRKQSLVNQSSYPASSHLTKQQGKQGIKYKTLYFFGIHYSVNSRDLDNLFARHQQGPFRHHQFIWHRMKDSISEFMQGRFEEKDANKILQIRDKLQVRGHPFIVVESQFIETDKLLAKIAQFQINIQFPGPVFPYYLLKGMKQCGRVIQIMSNNNFQQGRSDYYNVTFNSKQVCDQLKKVRKTPKQIIIDEVTPDNALYVYRPNYKTQLMRVNHIQDANIPRLRSPGRERPKDYAY